MIVTFICTGRDTHDPLVVWVYEGEIPVPERWTAYPQRSEMDLLCDRAKGGCGRAPRPGNAALRALVEAAAGHPSRTTDISFARL